VRAFTWLAFTQSVRQAQMRNGTREFCAKLERRAPPNDALPDELIAEISRANSFLIGTASREGWPHVQHRGGPPGFLRVLDPRTLAFADFRGNKQYITVGNLAENERVFLFLIDYSRRTRVKIWGRAAVVSDGELERLLSNPGYPAEVERIIRIKVEAWDRNCQQHIPQLGPTAV